MPPSTTEECTTPRNEYYVEVSPVSTKPVMFRRKYAVPVDPNADDKATKLQLCSFARPHMRAFHLSWISFFLAFFAWFSIPPLLPTIKQELNLSTADIHNSNILAVSSTILGRVSVGPLCDRFGPRNVQSILLIGAAVFVSLSAAVTNTAEFFAIRFFIGFVGCAFVCTQAWVADMFVKDIVGTANALAGGWGNLGGGATFLIMPLVFHLFDSIDSVSADAAWRLSMIFPAACLLAVGITLRYAADDTPRGKKHAQRPIADKHESALCLIKKALCNRNTIILAIQYACCFGVELQVNAGLGLYFYQEFKRDDCDPNTDPTECRLLSQRTAGFMASMFGLMNLVARALGGFLSDKFNQKYRMQGRIGIQLAFLLCEGILLFVFSRMTSLLSAGLVLVLFSLCVQGAEGTTFAIVPYVMPEYTGSIAGVVGAGGNVGAVLWGFLFKSTSTPQEGLMYLSFFVIVSCVLTPFIHVHGETSFRSLLPSCSKRR